MQYRLLLEATLDKRRDLNFLKDEVVRHPSVFEDAPEYLRRSFDFTLLAIGNADRATAQCIVNELYWSSSPSIPLDTFHGEIQHRLASHASFVRLILPALILAKESPLQFLNQGQTTLTAFETLIAEFAGAPTTFDQLRLLRRACENLDATLPEASRLQRREQMDVPLIVSAW